jgi:hypothetical protein
LHNVPDDYVVVRIEAALGVDAERMHWGEAVDFVPDSQIVPHHTIDLLALVVAEDRVEFVVL